MTAAKESSATDQAAFVVGIDLGTSNCALAYADPREGPDAAIRDLPIPQLVRPGEVAPLPLLPSAIYLPAGAELSGGAPGVQGDLAGGRVSGEAARWQGARVSGRLVASAKSWLCHPGVDRQAPILPWGAPDDVARISPVTASADLLQHLRSTWDQAHPNAPLARQDLVITVPASFDEVARALTVEAARAAGLEKFRLVEEPQAAFYDFTARHRRQLARVLEGLRLILVVDAGGGTTDFTLIQVEADANGPKLKRIAVGEHLLLGGDNMDGALARRVEEGFTAGGRRLSSAQWLQLLAVSRSAKETLLGPTPPETYNLSVASEGSALIGKSLSGKLTAAETRALILDGFFPLCPPDAEPRRAPRGALQEMGLPYVQDPAVTRHLAAFLRQHATAAGEVLSVGVNGLPRPDAVLLNGGVFNSSALSSRLMEVLGAWWPEQPAPVLLHHESLDLAVARGAAYYGLVRRGLGQRIGGGTAQSFYVGLRTGEDAPQAVCVVPRGQEESVPVELTTRTFHLTTDTPVQFPLYSSSSDRLDRAGDVVPVTEALHPLPPIHTLLKRSGGKAFGLPVHLRTVLTEIGTLELWCVANEGNEQWRLEFELRGQAAGGGEVTVTEAMPPRFEEARREVDLRFGRKAPMASPKSLKQLWPQLTQILGAREQWRLPVLRELWTVLQAGAGTRRRSMEQERTFWQLTGYCLRPGFGYPLDEWRCGETWKLFAGLLQFHKDKPNWNEFWILWRRIAGGLKESQQLELWQYLKPHLAARLSPTGAAGIEKAKGPQPEGIEEMVRTAASLEHVPASEKALLGDWISRHLANPATIGGPWTWALGRLGARHPAYGSAHRVVAAAKAELWITTLLPRAGEVDGGLFALSLMARRTGARNLDISTILGEQVAGALRHHAAPEPWVRMVEEVVVADSADEARMLGDTLPAGLKLV